METVQKPVLTPKIPNAQPLVRKIDAKKDVRQNVLLIVTSLVVVLAGILTGWTFSGRANGASVTSDKERGVTETATEAGSKEVEHGDTATGELVKGGIDGEGTHHLVTGEDESKYVYLLSTVIDLESFVGKKVQVWGETIAPQKAGWLMDVSRIKVVN